VTFYFNYFYSLAFGVESFLVFFSDFYNFSTTFSAFPRPKVLLLILTTFSGRNVVGGS
jgi:hypothetical protein